MRSQKGKGGRKREEFKAVQGQNKLRHPVISKRSPKLKAKYRLPENEWVKSRGENERKTTRESMWQ